MVAIRTLAALMLVAVGIYTGFVVLAHGLDFLTPFVGNIVAVNWEGQFQLDFTCFLLLAALWVAWRHRFTGTGFACSLAPICGGILGFAAYLLITSLREDGDVASYLVGNTRTAQRPAAAVA